MKHISRIFVHSFDISPLELSSDVEPAVVANDALLTIASDEFGAEGRRMIGAPLAQVLGFEVRLVEEVER